MVLTDSSVWIRSLANKEPFAADLNRLLAEEQVVAHDMVYGELLIGDRGGRRQFLESYSLIHRAKTIPHDEVVRFVRERELQARGTGWIDIHLLASAIAGGFQLWTADRTLALMATELGVAYQGPDQTASSFSQ